MANDDSRSLLRQRGFSIVELLVVVAIIGLMSAMSYPAIARYVRNYKIRSAAREVAGAFQSTRSKAVMSNTNTGVSFLIVDADSYRYVMEDLPAGERLSPLLDLPEGVEFQTADTGFSGNSPSVRFRRLGNFCYPGNPDLATCAASVPPACPTQDANRCSTRPGLNYVLLDTTNNTGQVAVLMRDTNTNLIARVRLRPGGRVATDYLFRQ